MWVLLLAARFVILHIRLSTSTYFFNPLQITRPFQARNFFCPYLSIF